MHCIVALEPQEWTKKTSFYEWKSWYLILGIEWLCINFSLESWPRGYEAIAGEIGGAGRAEIRRILWYWIPGGFSSFVQIVSLNWFQFMPIDKDFGFPRLLLQHKKWLQWQKGERGKDFYHCSALTLTASICIFSFSTQMGKRSLMKIDAFSFSLQPLFEP